MDTIRVAVTGAGSIIGQGILKALRLSDLPLHLIATDIAPLSSALYRADEGIVLPRVEDAGSLEIILERLGAARVDVVMIGSEFDLGFFSEHRAEIEQRLGCLVIVSPPETVAIADDKWLTLEFLRDNDLPYADGCLPQTSEMAVDWAQSKGFPVVLKTRRGTSSRHVHIVDDRESLEMWLARTPAPMLQELAGPVGSNLDSEWTCSAFVGRDGAIVGPFCSRRSLRGGSSWVVEVKPLPAGADVVMKIAEKLDHVGSINVQLMASQRGVVPFELNARFSGTTPIRAHYGFNEPEMAIRSYRLDEMLTPRTIRTGVVLRYIEEVFVDGVEAAELSEPFPRGLVRDWF